MQTQKHKKKTIRLCVLKVVTEDGKPVEERYAFNWKKTQAHGDLGGFLMHEHGGFLGVSERWGDGFDFVQVSSDGHEYNIPSTTKWSEGMDDMIIKMIPYPEVEAEFTKSRKRRRQERAKK